MIGRIFALSLALVLIGACAPVVDRSAADFDRELFYADLNNCRGGSVVEAALETTAKGLWSGAVGAYYGLNLGFAAGDRAEGMVIGAIVGATAGVGIGATASVREFNDDVSECLRIKGYVVS